MKAMMKFPITLVLTLIGSIGVTSAACPILTIWPFDGGRAAYDWQDGCGTEQVCCIVVCGGYPTFCPVGGTRHCMTIEGCNEAIDNLCWDTLCT